MLEMIERKEGFDEFYLWNGIWIQLAVNTSSDAITA